MAVQIQVDQPGAGPPPGIPGQAREDLLVGGFPIKLTATGGPFAQYLWSIIDKPVDIVAGVQSAAALATPLAATTLYLPVDKPGTTLVQVVVDSGSGLGALPEDTARITFYAGPALNVDPAQLPRRQMAFREQTEHNVPDAIFPAGNPRGWAEEWERWFAYLKSLAPGVSAAWGRVSLPPGGPATLVAGKNVGGVARVGVGVVDVAFTSPLPSANYAVVTGTRASPGGQATVDMEAVGGFRFYRADFAGVLTDADFSFAVMVNP